ncbi:hypothetical protein SAMN05661096_02544 [Marivirga sericea]|uniref:Outer membrane protein beta-barrel domain-containing protein n=1 Tax=Marivirga sericea TaxID=1028 RepID=A0A1X7KC21_9BACT|nr:hypothetical protein [Marivirga sericea]SMG38444.1 hypothetical protein SAMN05661096_02544 [Marivirga sericea]
MKKLNFIYILLFLTSLVGQAQIEDPKIRDTPSQIKTKIVVYTKTGEIYKGFFISQDKDFLEIETTTVGTVRIPTQRIKKIESLSVDEEIEMDEDERLQQINPVRYMLGTSAFNYEKGGNYLRNNPMTYHRGVTDNFSIGVGTSLWALVLRVPVIYVNPQFTKKLGKHVQYKIGLDAFAGFSLESSEGAGAAVLNTGITIGEPDLNLTGTVYYGAISEVQQLYPFYSLAGMARISKKLMLLSEGFYVPTEFEDNISFLFYGGRYLTDTASYDLGFFYNQEITDFIPFGIPFIAITIKL